MIKDILYKIVYYFGYTYGFIKGRIARLLSDYKRS